MMTLPDQVLLPKDEEIQCTKVANLATNPICRIEGTNQIEANFNEGNLEGPLEMKFRISSLMNPYSTKRTDSFVVDLFSLDGDNKYKIGTQDQDI